MPSKSNTLEFIQKSLKIHEVLYDYSKVHYTGSNVKVVIVCKIHGEFSKTPNKHLAGQGCRECSRILKNNNLADRKEEFVKKARKVHGEQYDYSTVNYTRSNVKVRITCLIHGVFRQDPAQHIKGQGCRKCGLLKKVSYSDTRWKNLGRNSTKFTGFKVYIATLIDRNSGEEFKKIGKTFTSILNRFHSIPYCLKEVLVIEHSPMFLSKLERHLHRINGRNSYLPSKNFSGHTECFSKVDIPRQVIDYCKPYKL